MLLKKCNILHYIEKCEIHVSHMTVLMVIEYMYVTSMNWSFLSNVSHFTKLKLL